MSRSEEREVLKRKVESLTRLLVLLERDRSRSTIGNDIFEAATYWRDLGEWLLEGSGKIDFPARAREEATLVSALQDRARSESTHAYFGEVFGHAHDILDIAASTLPPVDGYLGILKVLDSKFHFLRETYGLNIVRQEPLGRKYSSGSIWIELLWAPTTDQTSPFGEEIEKGSVFWPDDLVEVYGDDKFSSLCQKRRLETANDVELWFGALAELWQTYGDDVFRNRAGIFERLAQAQHRRDAKLDRTNQALARGD